MLSSGLGLGLWHWCPVQESLEMVQKLKIWCIKGLQEAPDPGDKAEHNRMFKVGNKTVVPPDDMLTDVTCISIYVRWSAMLAQLLKYYIH